MEAKQDLEEFRKRLPHGAIKIISDKSGIGYYTVLRVLNGDLRSPQTPEIISASIDYFTERGKKLAAVTQVLHDLLGVIDQVLDTEPIKTIAANTTAKRKKEKANQKTKNLNI